MSGLDGISAVQRDADRDRLAVSHRVPGEHLELVRGPVAEVERACAALLERIAAARDVLQVQLGAALDQVLDGVGCERRQRIGVRADPGEETSDRGSTPP